MRPSLRASRGASACIFGLRNFSGLIANLAAGALLLLALRAALAGAGPLWIAASLLGALVAHSADLALRWRR